jgi:hypothetical protein
VAPLLVLVLLRRPGRSRRALLLAAAPMLFLAAYNARYFGAAWSTGRDPILRAAQWVPDPFPALAGLLLSPGRGLFVYSPVLVFAAAGLVLGCVRRRPLFPALTVSVVLCLGALSLRRNWWGGWCYGPRGMADLLGILCFALLPVMEAARTRAWLRAAVLALCVPSVALHALGAFHNDLSWDGAAAIDRHPERLWSWSDGPVPHYARRPLASARRAHAALRLWLWRPPTSLEARGLAASYVSVTVPAAAPAGGRLEVRVTAFNTGRSVWLAAGPDERGTVGLAWLWTCADGPQGVQPVGSLALSYPVFPGESFAFQGRIRAPEPGGDCELVLGLYSQQVAWFSALQTPPVRVPVKLGVKG